MNRITLAFSIMLVASITSIIEAAAQPSESITIGGDYSVDSSFFQMPDGRAIGSSPSIELGHNGSSIWVVDRCGGNYCTQSDLDPIMEFDLTGRFLKSFGAGMFIRPHGLHIDAFGNIWVSDGEGYDGEDPNFRGKGHQVFKFSPSGNLLLTLGRAGIAGSLEGQFNKPSDILVAPNGNIFIADGHGGNSNARIVKFSADGSYIDSFGGKGEGNGLFSTPHTLAMDSLGRLYVGDRGNALIQVFTQAGEFVEQWDNLGDPSGIHIDPNDVLYVTDGTTPTISERGIRITSIRGEKEIVFIQDTDELASQEGITVDPSGNIYTSSTRSRVLKKYHLLKQGI